MLYVLEGYGNINTMGEGEGRVPWAGKKRCEAELEGCLGVSRLENVNELILQPNTYYKYASWAANACCLFEMGMAIYT